MAESTVPPATSGRLYLFQLPPQILQGEWLLYEVHPFFEYAVMGDDVGGITGHVQGF